ncbi:hypothetical protein CSB09_04385 [Candidatus Gracilibacteria bacterium]|nr:MAG: hypothetical protein CSB09_04385 [Candidatus Gracilibacteria bacterium]
MSPQKQIQALYELIQSAHTNIKSAQKILDELVGESKGIDFEIPTGGLATYSDEDQKIVEGIFTGESMLGADGNTYSVPQNYASKSLLVQGSRLKATINPNGKIIYKIIKEIPYETLLGVITKNGDKYQISTDKKVYNVLSAAITFHKCEVGDKVNIRIPEGKDATYAVIENRLPNL